MNMYSRSYFVDSLQPAALKLVNQLKDVAQSTMCVMDPVMVGACQGAQGIQDRRNICSKNIVTCGAPGHGYGFSNSIHLDNRDLTGRRRSLRYMEEVRKYSTSVSLPRHCEEKTSYVRKWIARFGSLSVPTTCAYEFIGSFHQQEACVMCFFLFPAVGAAIRVETGMGLQFYGAVLEHMTSVTLAVNHDIVSYSSEDNKSFVFAWGAGAVNTDDDETARGEVEQEDNVVDIDGSLSGSESSAASDVSDLFAAAARGLDDLQMQMEDTAEDVGLDMQGVFSTDETDEESS